MRMLHLAGLATVLALPLAISAQTAPSAPRSESTFNHGEVAAFGDLFRFTPRGANGPVNFLGLGARVGFNVSAHTALEAEMAYDFEKNYTSIDVNGTSGSGTSTTITTKSRPITGLFGPKFQFGTSGPFRAFLTGKAGFLQTSSTSMPASGSNFTGDLSQFGDNGTHFAAYPGGGIEAFIGPIGIRAEVGDEIFLSNGAHNNLRATFGPTIRF